MSARAPEAPGPPGDFVAARRRVEASGRRADDKLTTAAEAVRRVRDGDHIAIGGCMFTRTPLGLLVDVLRQRRTGLTLSKNLMCYEGEWFIAAGAAHTLVTSWFGIGVPWGLSPILREFAESGRVRVEDWSHMALGLRYRAGAMGVPFLPTLTMLGSDLMRVTGMRTMACPFTGQTVGLVPALFPDVALVHVHRADRFGNCQIDGYPFMDFDIVRAAATVIVSAERIVAEEEIRRHPDRTAIPGLLVDAVVEMPYGAFPHECHGLYEADHAHFDAYVARLRAGRTPALLQYLDEYVFSTRDHAEYLARFGEDALARQARKAQALMGG
jgi:glutaconate CoA-transferase subunit A